MGEIGLPDFDLAFYSAAGVTMLAGLIRGFSGFGSALVMVPILSVLYSPVEAVVLYVLVDFVGVAQMIPKAVKESDWSRVLPMSFGACLLLPIGVYILSIVDGEVMTNIVAVLVLVFTAILASGLRFKREANAKSAFGAGSLAGFLGGATGIGGPPIVIFYLSGASDIPKARASIAGYFIITDVLGLATYYVMGMMSWDLVIHAMILIPLFMLGVSGGVWLFPRASETVFRRVAYGLLFAVGVTALAL